MAVEKKEIGEDGCLKQKFYFYNSVKIGIDEIKP